ncbi:hypothetical protein ACW14Y_42810 (plasmid) [Kitasatospora sp. cg17-2]
MDEMRPRSEEPGAAGWDGVERRRTDPARAAVPEPDGRPAWRSPDRLPGRILVRVSGELGAVAVLKVVQVLAEYFR